MMGCWLAAALKKKLNFFPRKKNVFCTLFHFAKIVAIYYLYSRGMPSSLAPGASASDFGGPGPVPRVPGLRLSTTATKSCLAAHQSA